MTTTAAVQLTLCKCKGKQCILKQSTKFDTMIAAAAIATAASYYPRSSIEWRGPADEDKSRRENDHWAIRDFAYCLIKNAITRSQLHHMDIACRELLSDPDCGKEEAAK